MKALILAGGSGTRLRPFSYSMPKQLIPVANKPVLEYVVENLRDSGVTDIGIVVGESAAAIRESIGDGRRLGVRTTYLHQARPLGLAHCVRLARPYLGDDDFVMYLGDNMLPDGIAALTRRFRAERPDAQVVAQPVLDPRMFGVAEIDPGGRMLRVAEKPQRPRSDLALIGVYFFTAAVHQAVAAIPVGARGELEITDALQWMVDNGADVRVAEYHGYWKDTGRAEDVLACNRHVLDRLTSAVTGSVDADSVLTGPVVVEEGAEVVRSHLQGPIVVGAGSVVRDSRIGPYTSIGRSCQVQSADLADSIVLVGASISHVPGLRDSLIGRFATVGTAANTGQRLVVGDHTHIELVA